MNRHVVLALALTVGVVSSVQACKSLSAPLTASLLTDSTEIGVHSTGVWYSAKIGFLYTNTTDGPVAKAGCGGPPYPDLQKKVGEKWVAAYYPVYAACLSKPDFTVPSGGTFRGTLDFFAAKPGQNTAPELLVDSIDGLYRLEWDFVQGTDTETSKGRIVKSFSNEFRMLETAR